MSFILKYTALAVSVCILQVKNCKEPGAALINTEDYILWVENPENGLAVSKEMNDLVFSLQYKPHEYEILLQEKRAFTRSEMELRADSISDMQYYTFRIAAVNGNDVHRYHCANDGEYYARLEYFSLQMQNDVVLIDGTDTLPCLMFHYERTYGIDPRATFVLAFDGKRKSNNSRTLMYTDRVFGSGPVLLTIESSNLQQIPQLNLSE